MTHPWEEKRPISAWIPAGMSVKDKKVSRDFRPVLDQEKCVQCNLCWIFCPEGCIERAEDYTIDYVYCKGCGVCATECPSGAIEMVREGGQNE